MVLLIAGVCVCSIMFIITSSTQATSRSIQGQPSVSRGGGEPASDSLAAAIKYIPYMPAVACAADVARIGHFTALPDQECDD